MKATEIGNKLYDTSHFINTQEFNKLTKISFNAKMKEAEKSFVGKTEPNDALDLGDQRRIKKQTSNV